MSALGEDREVLHGIIFVLSKSWRNVALQTHGSRCQYISTCLLVHAKGALALIHPECFFFHWNVEQSRRSMGALHFALKMTRS